MVSETDIANMALGAMGARTTITSLIEDSNTARNANLYYPTARDEILAEGVWNFCRKTLTLGLIKSLPGTPENTDTDIGTVWRDIWPAPPWLYEYAYPSDCVKMRFIIPQGSWAMLLSTANVAPGASPNWQSYATPFVAAISEVASIEQRVILTNAQQAIGVYSKLITNAALYPPAFVSALVARLAYRLAVPLSGALELANANFTLSQQLCTTAESIDGNEGLTVIDNVPDWIRIRQTDYGVLS